MTFAAPLGLIALLAIPAIVAIHLLRRRFPPRPIAGLFLWKALHDVPDGGRRVDRLPLSLSLLLECLAALALALIIAGATLSSSSESEHLVVLLDDSVSMTAIDAAGESARDRAVRRVAEEVARLGPRGRITLVRSGERPAVLAGPAAFSAEAGPALQGWTPLARQHSLSAGLRLARELSGGPGGLLTLSDRAPDATAERLGPGEAWVALGVPLANVGIVDADRSAAPDGGGTLSLTLRNHSDSPASRVMRVTTGDREIAARTLTVPAGTSSVTLPLPARLPPLRVSLSGDALDADNTVTLVEPRPRIVAVENRLTGERGSAALDRAIAAVSGTARAEADAGHLAFVDAADSPAARAGRWQVRFGPLASTPPAGGGPADLIGPFVLEKRHPLLQGVTLGGVVWTGVVPLDRGGLHPVASAGDRTLIGTAPAAAGVDPAVVFNLDLARTNLIRSPDWPILISNLVEMRRRELPGPERWNYRAGELVRIRLDPQSAQTIRLRMGALERTFAASRLVEFVAPAPGGLAQVLAGDQVLFDIGINMLEEHEGDLRAATTRSLGTLGSSGERRLESGPAFDPLFWVLLAVCAAAILGNWWLVTPRGRRS
jgi:hypothetical protein